MKFTRDALRRFLTYALVGGGTFGLDRLLMAGCLRLGMAYPVAVYIGFFLGVSLNYLISRRYVFRGTSRSMEMGYFNMLTVAAMGAFATSSLSVLIVRGFDVDMLLARLPVAAMVGVGNYLFNLYANFDVAGRHHAR
ncbi:GtrA family protein [Agrobacterium sp. T29]|uniref:GtrA family protein n=1 Tax=Agrobacterium sp. T29 TaxID=2580515 RepID=UPI00115EB311|nr:GtrA family protein [Agrobacterium sp. T29]